MSRLVSPLPADRPQLNFRENFALGRVQVLLAGGVIYGDREYRGASEWARRRYNLSDAEMLALYEDYKQDYDS